MLYRLLVALITATSWRSLPSLHLLEFLQLFSAELLFQALEQRDHLLFGDTRLAAVQRGTNRLDHGVDTDIEVALLEIATELIADGIAHLVFIDGLRFLCQRQRHCEHRC